MAVGPLFGGGVLLWTIIFWWGWLAGFAALILYFMGWATGVLHERYT